MQDGKNDFIALLTYYPTSISGRKSHAASGYRPAIKFQFSEYLTSGRQLFIDKEFVNPGETVKAFIKIIATDIFKGSLTEGMEFDFREGDRIIGTGKILEILNKELIN